MSVRPIENFLLGMLAVAGCGDLTCPTGSVSTPEGRCVLPDSGVAADGAVTPDANDVDSAQQDADAAPCVPTGDRDLPDRLHDDTNCDGIDGTWEDSIFVSAMLGDDINEGVTSDAPVASIARGLTVASLLGRDVVVVDGGTYLEQLTLIDGISIFGGYDASMGWARTGAEVTVSGPSPVVLGEDLASLTVAELDVVADDAGPSGDSVGVRLLRSSAIALHDLDITAGAGGAGTNGAPAAASADGRGGSLGFSGRLSGNSCSGTVSTTPPVVGSGAAPQSACSSCGAGGDGGVGGFFWNGSTASMAGVGQEGASSEAFSAGGVPICPAHVGVAGGAAGTASMHSGQPGRAGVAGTNGEPGEQGVGAFLGSRYEPADGSDGTAGGGGDGGSGGGGGTGCIVNSFCYVGGGTGGGGGSGGCGGAAGAGGTGGGASVGLWLFMTDASLEGVVVIAGPGGDGGRGSDGAEGGEGGAGNRGGPFLTSGACTSGSGGEGGAGGAGGAGGGGAGGGGGPSVALLLSNGASADMDSDTRLTPGVGGGGGAGGGGEVAGPAGTTGASEATLTP
jgi:hypothetical protein